jgi:hypothetical protein
MPGEAALRKPASAGQRRFQVLRIRFRGLRIRNLDRTVARRRLAARAPGIAEDLTLEHREVREVLVLEGIALAAETAQAILDVGRVARLAQLAVVDDVDTRRDLLADDVGHRRLDARVQRRAVDGHALFLGEHHLDEVGRPRQAARVGGEESFGAALHRRLPDGFWQSYHCGTTWDNVLAAAVLNNEQCKNDRGQDSRQTLPEQQGMAVQERRGSGKRPIGMAEIEDELRQFVVALIGVRMHCLAQGHIDPCRDFAIVVQCGGVAQLSLFRPRPRFRDVGAIG